MVERLSSIPVSMVWNLFSSKHHQAGAHALISANTGCADGGITGTESDQDFPFQPTMKQPDLHWYPVVNLHYETRQ